MRVFRALKHLSYRKIVCCGGIVLLDEQTKILRLMGEIKESIDTNEFARRVGLSPAELMQQMQQLAKEGRLKKVGAAYSVSEKGRLALKAVEPVPGNMRFNFYLELNQPTGMSAGSVKEFDELALKVNSASLEFHLYRGDFENWFKSSVGDDAFAAELAKLKRRNLKCEELRKALTRALEARFSV